MIAGSVIKIAPKAIGFGRVILEGGQTRKGAERTFHKFFHFSSTEVSIWAFAVRL